MLEVIGVAVGEPVNSGSVVAFRWRPQNDEWCPASLHDRREELAGRALGSCRELSSWGGKNHTEADSPWNRDATPLALRHTRSYRGCRLEGSSHAQAGVVDRRPVPCGCRRVRRRIHGPRPRQRNYRGAIALVEHGALGWDRSRGRPTCVDADFPRGTDSLLAGTNASRSAGAGTRRGAGAVNKLSLTHSLGCD